MLENAQRRPSVSRFSSTIFEISRRRKTRTHSLWFQSVSQTLVRETFTSKETTLSEAGWRDSSADPRRQRDNIRSPSKEGNKSRRSRSRPFVVWNCWALDSFANAACSRNLYSTRAIILLLLLLHLHPPSAQLFCSCFKIFGLYERSRGVHKLYDAVPRDGETQRPAASRNIMSRRLFLPPAPTENTADKTHKLC